MNYNQIEKAANAFYVKVNAENKAIFRSAYENNRKALNSYKFWRHNPLPSFDELSFETRLKNSKGDFAMIDKKSGNSSETYNLKPTTRATKPFFRDLSKPILTKNELNAFHFKYLWDNVRKSEDFGGDNHIYMYYATIEIFCLLLCVEDITPYLQHEKFIFIFGEEDLNANYPLDFKKLYGIDYESMPSKPVRIDEIKRIFADWYIKGYTGNFFLAGVWDWHKNLLTMREFALSGFPLLYRTCLAGRTVPESIDEINKKAGSDFWLSCEIAAMFPFYPGGNPIEDGNKVFGKLTEIFGTDYRPTNLEWLKGFFLAFAMAMGRDLNQRIAPMIVMETHIQSAKGVNSPVKKEEMYDIYEKIPYFYSISIMRRPTVAVASYIDSCCRSKLKRNFIDYFANWLLKIPLGYISAQDRFLFSRRLIRFEDLKLEPKASLESALDFLDIEWDDILMEITSNGIKNVHSFSGKQASGYDTAAVYDLHDKCFSVFDTYRTEILIGKYYKHFGYKPLYYKDHIKYSYDEIKKLFEVRFKCEELHYNDDEANVNENARKKMLDYIERRIKNSDENAQTGEKLVPIPWLKPKAKFMKGKLYE